MIVSRAALIAASEAATLTVAPSLDLEASPWPPRFKNPFPDQIVAVAPPGFPGGDCVFEICTSRDDPEWGHNPLYRRRDKDGLRTCYLRASEMVDFNPDFRWMSLVDWVLTG